MFAIPPEHRSIVVLGCTHHNKPVLKLGDTGAAVVELQKLLLRWQMFSGYPASRETQDSQHSMNGIFNQVVKTAVETFQASMFLTPQGIVNPLTWQALYAGMPIHMPSIQLGSTGETVKILQRALLQTGDALPGTAINGIYSSTTEWAVRHFQRRYGLPVDGMVESFTWYTLSRTMNAIAQQRLPRVRGIDLRLLYVLSEPERDLNLEAAIRRSLPQLNWRSRYYYNRVDLNGDGKDEVLVQIVNPVANPAANAGSPLYVFQPIGRSYRLISQIGFGLAPVIVTEDTTNGWRDLIICTHAAAESDYWFVWFNGQRYIGGAYSGEACRVPNHYCIAGDAYLADDMSWNAGLRLFKTGGERSSS